MAEHAPPITISEMPEPDTRLQITIATPAEFAAIYLTPGTAFALMAALADFFGGDSSDDDVEDDGEAAE